MRRSLWIGAALLAANSAWAQVPTGKTLKGCILGAAQVHGVPPSAMVTLLMVEGGRLGMRSPNSNGTGDLGPLQINEIWIPKIAKYWGVGQDQAYTLVRDDLCSNAEAAAWIFGTIYREVGGNLWEAVARYHSMRPDLQQAYLRHAFEAAQRMRKGSQR